MGLVEVGSANISCMIPPTALGGPQSLSLEAFQLWAHIDDQAHRKEAKGAEQTQHGSSRECGSGEARKMGLEERVEPRGPCSESRTALPRAGWVPAQETTSEAWLWPPCHGGGGWTCLSHHPNKAMVAEGEDNSPSGSSTGWNS